MDLFIDSPFYMFVKHYWMLKVTMDELGDRSSFIPTSVETRTTFSFDDSSFDESMKLSTDESVSSPKLTFKSDGLGKDCMKFVTMEAGITVILGLLSNLYIYIYNNNTFQLFQVNPTIASGPSPVSPSSCDKTVLFKQTSEQQQVSGMLITIIKDVRFNSFEFYDKMKLFELRLRAAGGLVNLVDPYGKTVLHVIVEYNRLSYLQVSTTQ